MPYLIENQTMYMIDEKSPIPFLWIKRSEFLYIYDVNECRGCVDIQKELAAYEVHCRKSFHVRQVPLMPVPSCHRVA